MLLYVNAALALAFVGIYVAGALWDEEPFRFVVNSVAKDALFAALCLIGAADVRRHGWLALLVAFGYVALIAIEALTLAVGGQDPVTSFGVTIQPLPYLLGWMAIDIVLAAALVHAWWSAERARYGLRSLNPLAFRTLAALAEVLIEGPREALTAGEVARNVDGYLHRLDAHGKRNVRLAFTVLAVWPLLVLRPPFPAMSPDARLRFLRRRFIEDVVQRRTLRPLRPYVQALVRVASQMAYLGYYGDRRSWAGIGYEPFSKRPGGRPPRPEDRPGPRLRSLSAPPRAGRPSYDAIVVGSGAGGAIVAYRLAEAGRRVLVLERGPHVDPDEFVDDEVEQYLRLYNEGALQLATDFRLQVLQGMCVGGGTTVNNAVCFSPPEAVLERWQQHGIDPEGLRGAIEEVRGWLTVQQVDERVSSPGALAFAEGARRLRLPGTLELVEANIAADCLGCGYCNMGCPFGKKHSMLDTVLPWAQCDFPDRLDVLPDFRAERVLHEGGRALGVIGVHRGETLTIEADEVVLSAGAVASTWLLQRSGIAASEAGRELYFNVNSPLTADFPKPVRSYAGLQMSHAYRPDGDGESGFILETWFNPPATQALAMPGWFDRHYANMRRYAHMACGGALVGTTTPATITAAAHGPRIAYTPSKPDLARVVEGLKLLGRIFLAAGASRVMPATYAWHELRTEGQLAHLDDYVRDHADLLLTTAHPQGGNPVGERGQGGVVDADFRVHDFANLYVADASVFPTSVTVNPQLTVMGIAQYAARRITGVKPRIATETQPPRAVRAPAEPQPSPSSRR